MPALQLVFEDNDGSITLLEPKCIVEAFEGFEVESDQDPVGLTFLDSAGYEFVDEAFTQQLRELILRALDSVGV